MHFVGLFLSSLLKMHGPKNKIRNIYFRKAHINAPKTQSNQNISSESKDECYTEIHDRIVNTSIKDSSRIDCNVYSEIRTGLSILFSFWTVFNYRVCRRVHEIRKVKPILASACDIHVWIMRRTSSDKTLCDFDRASSLICGNKMPTRCNRGFYCRSYCLSNMFQAPLCPSSGAQKYYTVVNACGIWCCRFKVVGLVWSSEYSAKHRPRTW